MSFFETFIGGDNVKRVEKEVDIGYNEPFKLRPLTSKELNNLTIKNTNRAGDVDKTKLGIDMIVESVMYPDLNKTEVMEAAEKVYEIRTGKKTKITNPSDALTSMLLPGELNKLAEVVSELSGATKKEEEEDKEFRQETD